MGDIDHKVRNLEMSIEYLQTEHAKTLKLLHEEVKELQMTNKLLTFEASIKNSDKESETERELQGQVNMMRQELLRMQNELIETKRRLKEMQEKGMKSADEVVALERELRRKNAEIMEMTALLFTTNDIVNVQQKEVKKLKQLDEQSTLSMHDAAEQTDIVKKQRFKKQPASLDAPQTTKKKTTFDSNVLSVQKINSRSNSSTSSSSQKLKVASPINITGSSESPKLSKRSNSPTKSRASNEKLPSTPGLFSGHKRSNILPPISPVRISLRNSYNKNRSASPNFTNDDNKEPRYNQHIVTQKLIIESPVKPPKVSLKPKSRYEKEIKNIIQQYESQTSASNNERVINVDLEPIQDISYNATTATDSISSDKY